MASPVAGPVVVGVFDERAAAEQAVQELHRLGFDDDQIGFVVREPGPAPSDETVPDEGDRDTGAEVAKGAATGTLVGGIVGGLASALIPGIGPVVAAGVLAGVLSGAAVGAAGGALLASLVGLGIPEEEARYYEREVQAGRAVVTVRAGARSAEAEDTLHRFGAHPRRAAPTGRPDVRPPGG
jgi:Heat induced stress protein YflT